MLRVPTGVSAPIDRIEWLAVEQDLTRVGVEDAGDHADERGLAGAIGAEQSEDRTLIEVEAEFVDGNLCSEVLLQVGDLQDSHRQRVLRFRQKISPVKD